MKYRERVDSLRRRPVVLAQQPPSMARRFALPVLALLGLLVVAIVPAASVAADPPELENVFCTSSIDPRCQPQNLPILIEAGIISAPAATATGGASTGAVAAATVTGGAGVVGVSAVLMNAPCGSFEACESAPVLGYRGWQALSYKPSPTWAPPAADFTDCVTFVAQTGLAAAGYPTAAPTCDSVRASGSVPNGRIKVTVTGTTTLTLTTTVIATGTSASVGIRGWCMSASSGIVSGTTIRTINVGSSSGSPFTDAWTPGCAAGYQPMIGLFRGSSWGSSTGMGIFYANGGPFVTPAAGEVTAQSRAEVYCENGAGVVTTRTGTATNAYTVGQTVAQTLASALCLPTEVAVGGGIDVSTDGGSSWTRVLDADPVPEVITELPAEFPDCWGTGAGCTLTLWQVQPDGSLQYCGSIGQLCYGWAQTPLDTIETQYQCRYGQTIIDLRYCSAYRDPAVGVQPNVDEDGGLLPWTAPNTAPGTGTPVDPETGLPLPEGGTSEDPDAVACWPEGWGVFNPFSWIYLPMRCALQWAFVPRQTVMTQVAVQTQTAWADTVVGQGIDVVAGIGSELPDGVSSACAGPPVTFGAPLDDFGMDGTWYPLNSCDEPMATIRGVAYWALPAFTAFGLMFALVRYAASILGYIGFGYARDSEEEKSGVKFS